MEALVCRIVRFVLWKMNREKKREGHAGMAPLREPNQIDLPPCFCFSNCRFGTRMACTACCVSALSADLLLCPRTFPEGWSGPAI